jgi:hypothetical protein
MPSVSHVELPRVLEDYFAFAELERTETGRRFSITLPYLDGARLDRLQWWWRVGSVQERLIGEAGVLALRVKATERFQRHIERWLENTGQRLHGDGPIPLIGPIVVTTAGESATSSAPPADGIVVAWPQRRTGS